MAFRNIDFFGQVTERKQIRENVIWFLREQLLNFGAYYNMASGVTDLNGVAHSKLLPSYQPEHSGASNVTSFFKGRSNQWVWESGISHNFSGGSAPLIPSGVYIGSNFVSSSATGLYSHYIDYNRGGVVFNSPISSGTNVHCYRTERAAFVYNADSTELRKINAEHLRVYQQLNYPMGSGFDNTAPEYYTFLPAIFVDIKFHDTNPYELGDSLQYRNFDVVLDIVASNIDEFDVLRDMCTNLENQNIWLFDVNEMIQNNKYPLDYLGRKKSDALTRAGLIAAYPWRKGRFLENSKENMYANILPVRRGTITIGFEVIL